MIPPVVYVRRRVFTAMHCGRADTGPAHCDEVDCRWCNVCRRHLTGGELEWKYTESLERAIVVFWDGEPAEAHSFDYGPPVVVRSYDRHGRDTEIIRPWEDAS